MSFAYSDGAEIEAHILQLLRESDDLSSDARIAWREYGNWPTHYHLCRERSNLFRHLNFAGLDVLELGAGMGGVSRYIAEHARTLTAVEGSKARFAALSERLRDLRNWNGEVANIQDYRSEAKHDVACLIGVLEYSGVYIDDPDPYRWVLRHTGGFLKDDGVLLLAIENKHGLKYWAGAPEDHTGQLYDGICGYRVGKTPRTFSRRELLEMLRQCGYERVEEFYPWPDYKLPSDVISREMLSVAPTVAGEIASGAIEREDRVGPRYFPDSLAIHDLTEAGYHGEFANSFLFACAKRADSTVLQALLSRQMTDRELAWHYTVHRLAPTTTVIALDKGELFAVKRTEVADAPFKSNEPTVDPVLTDPRLSTILARHAYFGDDESFHRELVRFLRWSLSKWEASAETLNPVAIDCIVTNAVPTPDGEYRLFDLEWVWPEPMSKSWFVLRNVIALRYAWQMNARPEYPTLLDMYERLCEELGIRANLEADLHDKATFQVGAAAGVYDELVQRYREVLAEPSNSRGYARDAHTELVARGDLQTLSIQYSEMEREMARLRQENHNLRAELTRRGVRIALAADRALRRVPGVDSTLRALAKMRHRSG